MTKHQNKEFERDTLRLKIVPSADPNTPPPAVNTSNGNGCRANEVEARREPFRERLEQLRQDWIRKHGSFRLR